MSQVSPTKAGAWQQLVRLGGRFLNEPDTAAQKKLIVQFAQDTLNCHTELWLAEHFSAPSAPEQETFLSEGMRNAIAVKHMVWGEPNDLFYSASKRPAKKTRLTKAKIVAIPMLFQDTVLGAIEFSRQTEPLFNSEEIEILEGLTAQAAIAFQAAHQIASDRRQLELLSLVRLVSAQIAEVLNPEELSQRVTELILHTFDYYYVAIFTNEVDQPFLCFRHSAKRSKGSMPSFSVRVGEGIIGHVAATGGEILANDVGKNPHYRELDSLPETRSEIALPLKIEDRILGVLDIQSDQINTFSDMDMLVLRSLADHIATALENARLYSDVQRKVKQLASVAEISNAIVSILDGDVLLKKVAILLNTRLGYPGVRIYVVHTGRRKVICKASFPEIDLDESIDLDDPEQGICLAARTGQVTVLKRNCQGTDSEETLCNEIIIPLVYANEVLGILDIEGNSEVKLSEDDRFLLEALASNIAIAMRNSFLYRSELWRRNVAESMREVAGLLTTEADLEQVLQVILAELERTLPVDAVAIWLIENPQEGSNGASLRMAAVNISNSFHNTNPHSDFSAEEIKLFCNQSTIPSPWLQEALETHLPLTRSPEAPYEPLGAILDFPAEYSAIAAPLRAGNQSIGLLVLAHHTGNRYGHEAQSMTATFASYAAVAIENTRLYESAHDQAWVSTVLLQVAEATQALNSLDELLSTMARITPSLIGVNSCSIFLWNNYSETFIPTASFSFLTEPPADFRSRIVQLGDLPAFDRLFFSKNPVVIDPQQATLDADTYPVARLIYSMYNLDISALVLFPMLAHGDVLGLFLIDYHIDRMNGLTDNVPKGITWEEKFVIIQGVAHQTAVAVENMQLLKVQQEEAYISVALLQVAQAVVSLNALDEILESIVRLTPILIGVKRCAIFLWDAEYQQYTLAESYGFQKNELISLGNIFKPDEFPLLDLVRQKNQLAVHIQGTDTENPLAWNSIDGTDCEFIHPQEQPYLRDEISGQIPTSEQLKQILRTPSNLLFGFPLAVKGKVLGIMLTQEMDIASPIALVQTREKRHEIAIGIIQQAALAIQNDLLQREVLTREKLEREFQLAREIQQTFLPDHLPQPEGWELNALWRPARQVSGDFYDIFELPNQRLGMVIADVADKGMPAALFMTLIRTLIRATIRETLSPAEALEKVNDLLIPDTRNGMFVTVIYAVVSLETGEIQYANAGHNPPLLTDHVAGSLKALTRTGMALGVIEGTHITQANTYLQPEEAIIFYTDGITEAFSSEDEMFGEARLRETILDNLGKNATQLTQAIDRAVSDFLNDTPFSDDLTLLVLYRSPATEAKPHG